MLRWIVCICWLTVGVVTVKLYFDAQLPVQPVKESESRVVISGFAYRQPIILPNSPEVVSVSSPAKDDAATHHDGETMDQITETPVPGTSIEEATCVTWGPFVEKDLPSIYKLLKSEADLLQKLFIENISSLDEYVVYVGPVKEKVSAERLYQELRKKEIPNLSIVAIGTEGYGVLLGRFYNDQSARNWAQHVAQKFEIRGVTLSRQGVAMSQQVRLIFQNIEKPEIYYLIKKSKSYPTTVIEACRH